MIKTVLRRGLLVAPFFLTACSVTAVRPTQEMSNMEVAIRAAKEVNADQLAPELYRMANETSLKARREYRFKNFEKAKRFADEARDYAERAEFESMKNGAKRDVIPSDPLADPSYAPIPISTPVPGAEPKPGPSAPAAKPTIELPPLPSN